MLHNGDVTTGPKLSLHSGTAAKDILEVGTADDDE